MNHEKYPQLFLNLREIEWQQRTVSLPLRCRLERKELRLKKKKKQQKPLRPQACLFFSISPIVKWEKKLSAVSIH